MGKALIGAAWLLAALFTLIGVRWIVDPAGSAEALGMPLLEGAARSSQIGDLTSFFLGGGLMTMVGLRRRIPALVAAAGLLVGSVALFRTLAWALHDAAFTPAPIVVEVVTLVVLLATARLLVAAPEPHGAPGSAAD